MTENPPVPAPDQGTDSPLGPPVAPILAAPDAARLERDVRKLSVVRHPEAEYERSGERA